MKAILHRKYGPPEVLTLEDYQKPEPGDDELLVKIKAGSVTRGDIVIRSGKFPGIFWLPARLIFGLFKPKKLQFGWEFSGIVEEVGAKVSKFAVGDAVFGSSVGLSGGGLAEYICTPETRTTGALAKKPGSISHEEAATAPVGGLTALHFLDKANIQPGQKVLVYGASGSVGTFAVQLARHYGTEVTGLCSADNIELVESLGADQVIDYNREDYSQLGQQWDVIFDTVGKSSYKKNQKVLAADGHLLYSSSGLREMVAMITGGKKISGGVTQVSSEKLEHLADLLGSGTVKSVIDRVWPLEEIAAAHRYVESEHKKGNVAIRVD